MRWSQVKRWLQRWFSVCGRLARAVASGLLLGLLWSWAHWRVSLIVLASAATLLVGVLWPGKHHTMSLGRVANYLTLVNSIGVVLGGVVGVLASWRVTVRERRNWELDRELALLLGDPVPEFHPTRTFFADSAAGITVGWAGATLLWLAAALAGGRFV